MVGLTFSPGMVLAYLSNSPFMAPLRLVEKGNGLGIAVVVVVPLVWSANGEIKVSSGRLIDPTTMRLTVALPRAARLQHKIIYV